MVKKTEEPKICVLCKRIIDLERDNYCRLTDWNQGKFYLENYYHTTCYNNQIKGVNPEQNKMKKAAFSMLQRANKLLNKAEGKPEEVYEVT